MSKLQEIDCKVKARFDEAEKAGKIVHDNDLRAWAMEVSEKTTTLRLFSAQDFSFGFPFSLRNSSFHLSPLLTSKGLTLQFFLYSGFEWTLARFSGIQTLGVSFQSYVFHRK